MTRHNDNDVVTLFRMVSKEYEFTDDVMDEDDPKIRKLKYIINKKLSVADRTIILLYAECASLRKVAEMMNISHTTIATEIKRIKNIIIEQYGNIH